MRFGRQTRLVKNTAKEMAGAFYDGQDMFHDGRMSRTEKFRIKAGTQAQFVETYWRDFVVLARKTLAQMLADPGRPQADKDAIYDALLQERGAYTDEELAAPSVMRLN